MKDPFDNDLLGGAQKKVESFDTIDFQEDCHCFTATVHDTKSYVVVLSGYPGKASLSVWEIGHNKTPVAEVAPKRV